MPPEEPATAPVIPGYELIKVIGGGTFGTVWMAKEEVTGIRRAVKVLDKGDERLAQRDIDGVRCFQEVSQNHPHLLPILIVGKTPEYYYYAMELADNATRVLDAYNPLTLRVKIQRTGRFDVPGALQIVSKLLGGVARLHDQATAHNDFKPENILFVDGEPKLADPSLVGSLNSRTCRAGAPAYMTPEGAADDSYAAGKVMYEMISGHEPRLFPRLPAAVLDDRSGLMRPARLVMNKACARNPKERYDSPSAFREAIDNVLRRPSMWRWVVESWTWRTRRQRLAAVIGSVLVAAGVMTGLRATIQSNTPRVTHRKIVDLQSGQPFEWVRTTENSSPLSPYLSMGGSPMAEPALYRYKLESPLEHFQIDLHLSFRRPWGYLTVGLGTLGTKFDGPTVTFMGQPNGEGLATILSTYDRLARIFHEAT
ncbi:MAG: protein kinase [Planctomycetes bacterium]|nr:protein kinase [Planctomycetota bacterium]